MRTFVRPAVALLAAASLPWVAGCGSESAPAPSSSVASARPAPVGVGGVVPDFTLTALDGGSFSLAKARAIAPEDAWKAVTDAAARFGAAGAPKKDDAVDALPGVKGDGAEVDAERRLAFVREAGRPYGLIASADGAAGLKTLGDVAAWIAGASEAPIVLMAWASTCPTSRGYEPRLIEAVAKTGARLYPLACNAVGETDDQARQYVSGSDLPYRVLSDREQVAADLLGAQRTPHAFVLDGRNVLRYAGSIDDDPNEDKAAEARTPWLELAIVAASKGRDPDVRLTLPKG